MILNTNKRTPVKHGIVTALRRVISLALVFIFICFGFLTACTTNTTVQYADNPIAGRETLTQISTIDAILNGVYDGVVTYGVLKGYGDFGIGTFKALDGEMLAFDSVFYQIKADGIAYVVADEMETPFASMTFFDADYSGNLPQGLDFTQLQEYLDSILPSENEFYAIKIEGTFSYMKTRSVPAQEKPYPPLVEVTKNQPVFEFENVAGTLVGFRSPPYVAGVNVPGYHLHFLTADKKAGGHVLDFIIEQADVAIDYTADFMMILPGEGSDFYRIDLTPNKHEELEQAEK